ncbi:MAG: hypothetical protein J5892_05105 [Bacilli bacterium]|nr:hypothetical protein [Bacilli bacterium]
MEKLSLSKLIANDIVNYGMDKTMGFQYVVSLSDFLDEYDEESRDYIKSHIKEIINDVEQNENVADLHYDEKEQDFDMVFYFDGLMNKLDKIIYEIGRENGTEYELEDVRNISYDLENSDSFKDLINEHLSKKEYMDMGTEM